MPLAIGHGPRPGPVIEDSSAWARRFQGLNAPGYWPRPPTGAADRGFFRPGPQVPGAECPLAIGHGPRPGPRIEDSSDRARRFQGLNAPGYWPRPPTGAGDRGFFRLGPQVPGAECPWLLATAPDRGRG